MAFRFLRKRLGVVVGVMIALTMSAVAVPSPASAATITGSLKNYHAGVYLIDEINRPYDTYVWTHSVDASYSVIKSTSGHCLYNVDGTTAAVIGGCSPTNHAFLWQASSVVSIGGSISWQFRNYHTGTCLYMNDSGTRYLATCSSNHADYWHDPPP